MTRKTAGFVDPVGVMRLVRLVGVVALGLGITLATAPAMAQGMDRSMRNGGGQRLGGGGQWWNNPEMIEALELGDETRQAIDDQVYRTQQEMITLRADVERQNLQLQRLLSDQTDSMDLAGVESQVDRLVGARGAAMKEEILLRARIMAMLTPDQRARLEELFEERRQQFRDRARQRQERPSQPRREVPPDEPPDGRR